MKTITTAILQGTLALAAAVLGVLFVGAILNAPEVDASEYYITVDCSDHFFVESPQCAPPEFPPYRVQVPEHIPDNWDPVIVDCDDAFWVNGPACVTNPVYVPAPHRIPSDATAGHPWHTNNIIDCDDAFWAAACTLNPAALIG